MIEFEEGTVCYAFGHLWMEGDKMASFSGDHLCDVWFPSLLVAPDFQLNEPREGWCIPKSELDTEEKYNQAVEVFVLLGFNLNKYHKGYSELVKVWRGIEIYHGELASTNATDGTKCTYTQLMAIGELKRRMLEREKSKSSAVSKVNRDIEARLNFPPPKVRKTQGISIFNETDCKVTCKLRDSTIEINMGKESKPKRRNKSKKAYDILKGLDYEYDLVKQKWFKKEWV